MRHPCWANPLQDLQPPQTNQAFRACRMPVPSWEASGQQVCRVVTEWLSTTKRLEKFVQLGWIILNQSNYFRFTWVKDNWRHLLRLEDHGLKQVKMTWNRLVCAPGLLTPFWCKCSRNLKCGCELTKCVGATERVITMYQKSRPFRVSYTHDN